MLQLLLTMIGKIKAAVSSLSSKLTGSLNVDTQIVTTVYANTLTKINNIKLLNLVGIVSISDVSGWTNVASIPNDFLCETTVETLTTIAGGIISVQISDGYVKFRPGNPISNVLVAFDLVYV